MTEKEINISVKEEELEALTSVLVSGFDFYKNTPEKEPGQYAEEMRNLNLATKLLNKLSSEFPSLNTKPIPEFFIVYDELSNIPLRGELRKKINNMEPRHNHMCSLTPKFIIDAVKEMADGQPGKTITIADLREYAQSCSSLLMDELLQEDPENTCETEWLGISIWRHCNLLEREISDEIELSFSVKK